MSKITKTISKPRFVRRLRDLVPTKPVHGRNGIRHIGGLILGEAIIRNVGTFGVDANGKKFDFLGYTFRPRAAVNRKGKLFCSFSPAISKKAVQKISDEMRTWQLHRRTACSIEDLAKMLNPKLRGWFTYYGHFNPSALRPIERHVGQSLVRWACRKYKKLRGHRVRAWSWLIRLIERQPTLLALWERQRGQVFTMGAV